MEFSQFLTGPGGRPDLKSKTTVPPTPAPIVIAEHGTPDGSPDATRTGHLRPVIDFIKSLGFVPLADRFVFDKSGYGQFMFSQRPDAARLTAAAKQGLLPPIFQGASLGPALAQALRARFRFPAMVEVTTDGSVFDDANALQIGFSGLPQHPMQLTPQPS